VHYAAAEVDKSGAEALPAIFSAKAEAAECVVNVVNESMTLMGGSAYQECGPLGRLLRDARAAHVMSPTTDILRTWTGRALLGQPLLGE
jgi:alkylation response protein AidB-like acyl-CoA dehydrogenase